MAYIEPQHSHFDKKVSKEMRLRPIFNRRDIVLWTTLGFGGSPPESQAQVIVPRSIAENRGVYKAHFAAIVRPSKIRN